ncbi:cytochrome c family protein [bacterium]|nr:cytochrome c family protein [bacterium]
MPRLPSIVFGAAIVLALGFAGAVASTSRATPPAGAIEIAIPGQAKKPPVRFDHETHVEFAENDCQKCHHADPPATGSRCVACHDADGGAGAMPGRKAFHQFCNTCHTRASGAPRFPRDCVICHTPKNRLPQVRPEN